MIYFPKISIYFWSIRNHLGEGPLANKQVWILRMGAAILSKEKVNNIGTGGSKQTDYKEGGSLDGEQKNQRGSQILSEPKMLTVVVL